MRHKHPAAAKLVGGVRVKRNHTIIMTTPNEVGLLHSMVKGLQSQGFDARVYEPKQSRLAHAAQRGVDKQMRGVGVCNHFAQQKPCFYGVGRRTHL